MPHQTAAVHASTATHTTVTNRTDRQALSVIIPARNEAEQIGQGIEQLLSENVHEVIVVDGQSQDNTASIAASCGAKVIHSRPGRGRQLAMGAAVATGQTLFFLHADTRAPVGFARIICETLSQTGVVAGAFRLAIDGHSRPLRVIEKLVDWRSRRLKMPYGDQGLFLTKETYHRIGGYEPIPAMEDVRIIKQLRRVGSIAIADHCVTTSARRWEQRGVWRATIVNQCCLLGFTLGVSPTRLAEWRDRQTLSAMGRSH